MRSALVAQGTPRETAGVTTRLIVSFVRRRLGDDGVRRLLDLAGDGRPVEVLEDELGWSSYAQKVALFEAAATLTGDDEVARRIGEALLEQQIGAPLRLAIGALGSPQQVLRSCARANVKFSTNSTMQALEARKGRAVVTYRVDEGYTPNRHDCLYTHGVLSQASVLFGLPPAQVEHERCQSEGAEACRFVVTWRGRRRWLPGRTVRPSSDVEILETRIADLEATVADLVSPRELDEMLDRIASRAGAAVRGQRFLLVVELEGEGTSRVLGSGFESDEAARLATDLRATAGGRLATDHDLMISEVASSRRSYGYLAAFLPFGKGFLPSEQGQLDAYARLAAAALDSATAVRDSRRGEATAQAILALAHALAHERDETTVARRIVEAIPAVVGCDRSSLLVRDPVKGCLAVLAAHGYGELSEAASAFAAWPDTPAAQPLVRDREARVVTRAHPDPWVGQLLDEFDAEALVIAPIVVRDEFIGLVVADWRRGRTAPIHEPTALRAVAGVADHAGIAIVGLRLLQRARHQAEHDPLTGLANRARFAALTDQVIADRRRPDAPRAAVCFLDLDGFKAVNDAYGHAVGDRLLVEVAARLQQRVRDTDVVARISGDEFGVLLRDLAVVDDASTVADELIAAVSQPLDLDGVAVSVGVSVGITEVPASPATPSVLLQRADAAMYQAKAEGGNRHAWHRATATRGREHEAEHAR